MQTAQSVHLAPTASHSTPSENKLTTAEVEVLTYLGEEETETITAGCLPALPCNFVTRSLVDRLGYWSLTTVIFPNVVSGLAGNNFVKPIELVKLDIITANRPDKVIRIICLLKEEWDRELILGKDLCGGASTVESYLSLAPFKYDETEGH